mgnify:CR=1 FL=1
MVFDVEVLAVFPTLVALRAQEICLSWQISVQQILLKKNLLASKNLTTQ